MKHDGGRGGEDGEDGASEDGAGGARDGGAQPAAPATAQLGLQPSVGEYASALGAVATAFLLPPLAARQKLRLSTLHRQLTALPCRATEPPATSQPSSSSPSASPPARPRSPAGGALLRGAPLASSAGHGRRPRIRRQRACFRARPGRRGRRRVAARHAREVLLRVAPAPPAALAELSVVELNVTYARAGEVDTLCCGWASCCSARRSRRARRHWRRRRCPCGQRLHPRPLPAAPGGRRRSPSRSRPSRWRWRRRRRVCRPTCSRPPPSCSSWSPTARRDDAHRREHQHDEDLDDRRRRGGGARAFVALCEATPCGCCSAWTARTEQATPRPGPRRRRSRSKRRFEEALAFALLLAKSSVPPFDGTAADHAAERERFLATYESKAHDPFAMMVDDDPSVSYAPLRVHDFDLESVLPP